MADLPERFTPHLIVLGSNSTGRFFGSAFPEAEAEAAERAAGQMDLHVIRVQGDELTALAADLPRGKVFAASGNAFVPLAARTKVEQLMALGEAAGTLSKPPKPEPATALAESGTEATGEAPVAEGGADELAHSNVPSSWAAITLRSLVLMRETGEQEGWYDAVVTEVASVDDPDSPLTLRYVEFQNYPAQTRRREELALLPPQTIAQ